MRVHGNEREPGSLHLHHKRMSRKEMMVNVTHREIRIDLLAGLERQRLLEAFSESERHDISSHQHLVAVRSDIYQFHNDIRICQAGIVLRRDGDAYMNIDRSCEMKFLFQNR